jgi:predicted RNA binding protein YcfA (HicA-like mRNA interferase family)
MPRVSFAALEQVLVGLGFTVRKVPGSHTWFEHPGSNTRILLPPFRQEETVDQGNLVAVRRHLDEKGLMPRARFDELLRERSLVG